MFMDGNYQLITGKDSKTGLLTTPIGALSLLHEDMDILQKATQKVIAKKKELNLPTNELESYLRRLEDLMTIVHFSSFEPL